MSLHTTTRALKLLSAAVPSMGAVQALVFLVMTRDRRPRHFQTDVAHAVGHDPVSTAQAVRALRRAGLLTRAKGERGQIEIGFTEAGTKLANQLYHLECRDELVRLKKEAA